MTDLREKTKEINDILIDKGFLAPKSLKEIGITDSQFKRMVREGQLRKESHGHYLPTSIEDLYASGISLLEQGEVERAELCFKRCYHIDPRDPKTNLKMFFIKIKDGKYDNLKAHLDVLSEIEDESFRKDFNFYLLLLSFFTELPSPYNEIAKSLNKEDIITYKGHESVSNDNLIRSLAFDQKFNRAIRLHNNSQMPNEHELIKYLLLAADQHKNSILSQIKSSIKEGNFRTIRDILRIEAEKHYLILPHKMILMITEDIIEMQEKGVILGTIQSQSTSLEQLVQDKDYPKALYQHTKYLENRGIPKENDLLGPILIAAIRCRDINIARSAETKDLVREESSLPASGDLLTKMYEALINMDPKHPKELERPLEYMRTYLAEHNLSEYDYLIEDMIRICIYFKDPGFNLPMVTISALVMGTYEMNISEFIEEFKHLFYRGYFKEARLYLDIIEKASARGHSDIDPGELSRILEPFKTRLQDMPKAENKTTYSMAPVDKNE